MSVPSSDPVPARWLLAHAGIENLASSSTLDTVVDAVARAVDGGRTVTLPVRPANRARHLLGTILLALVIGVAMVLARVLGHPWLAAMCAAGVGPFLIFHLLVALPRSGALTLDRRGMTVRYAFRNRAWNWSEIDGFETARSSAEGPLRVSFSSTRPEDTDTPGILEWIGVRGLTLTTQMPDRYGLETWELAALLRSCREMCAPRTADEPPREIGSPATARLLNACGGVSALLALSWFGVLWVAPTDPVTALVICAICIAAFGILYLLLRSRITKAPLDHLEPGSPAPESRHGPTWTPQVHSRNSGQGTHRRGRSRPG